MDDTFVFAMLILAMGFVYIIFHQLMKFLSGNPKKPKGATSFVYKKESPKPKSSKPKKMSDAEVIRKIGGEITRSINNSDTFHLLESQLTKLKKSSGRSITKSYLTGCSWLMVNNDDQSQILYTFRNNNELIITNNGDVDIANYELIVDNNSILIKFSSKTEHHTIVNVKDDFLFLNKFSTDKTLVFANYTKYKDELKSVLNQHFDNLIKSYQ